VTTFNPFDPVQVDAQDVALAELRAKCPVSEALPGMFLVTRHDDVLAVTRDTSTFHQGPFRPLDEDTRGPDEKQLGESDPPYHTAIRRLLQGVLSTSRVKAMEPLVSDVCNRLAADLATRSRAEIIRDLGEPLPQEVIGALAGLPPELRGQHQHYSGDVVLMVQAPEGPERDAAIERVEAFDRQLLELIRQRRQMNDRPDDAMTALVEATDEAGGPLSDSRILTHLAKDVITGGIDTTTHLVGSMFWELLANDGLYQRVRADRSLVPRVVEETLRLRPVVNVLFRRPTVDTAIAGVDVPAGSTVLLSYASANHDHAVFSDPETFDVDRDPAVVRKHLGFGWGIHLCVGAALARLEATTLLNAVLDHVPGMRLADDAAYERIRVFMMRGPQRVDVEIGR
jgi:cytochrome P450